MGGNQQQEAHRGHENGFNIVFMGGFGLLPMLIGLVSSLKYPKNNII